MRPGSTQALGIGSTTERKGRQSLAPRSQSIPVRPLVDAFAFDLLEHRTLTAKSTSTETRSPQTHSEGEVRALKSQRKADCEGG